MGKMTPRQSQLYLWSRPEGILVGTETNRIQDWLELYDEVLSAHATNPADPTQLERIVSRGIAADVWRCDRANSDAALVAKEIITLPTRTSQRHAYLRDADERCRIRAMAIQSAVQQLRMLGLARNAHAGDDARIIPLRRAEGA